MVRITYNLLWKIRCLFLLFKKKPCVHFHFHLFLHFHRSWWIKNKEEGKVFLVCYRKKQTNKKKDEGRKIEHANVSVWIFCGRVHLIFIASSLSSSLDPSSMNIMTSSMSKPMNTAMNMIQNNDKPPVLGL